MTIFKRVSMLAIITVLILASCTPVPPVTPTPSVPEGIFPESGDVTASAVNLVVTALNGAAGFTSVGQVMNYRYDVRNNGPTPLAGPVTVTDDKTTAPICPGVNTVGNFDNNLDNGESLSCVSAYTITAADITATQVTSNAVARVGGIDSNRVTTTIRAALSQALTLTCTANPTSFSAAGQTITYTYTVRNTGASPIGPTQFTVKDSLISAPINCDIANRTLGPNETISCTGTYLTTQNDLNVTQIANSVTATGGTATSAAGSCPVTRAGGGPGTVTPQPTGNFTKGQTVQHIVNKGEWLIQIGRCYSADLNALKAANPHVLNPNLILPAQNITVPNIGSVGNGVIYRNYGPCVGYHSAVSGDTFESLATRYNASFDVLRAANIFTTVTAGACVRIPLNSAGGATPATGALPACPGTPTAPGPRDPIRVNIPQGTNTVTLSNTVDSTSKVRFLLATTQGQTLGVKVTAAANEVSLGVFALANGATLKAQDTTLTFNGTIPVTGDTAIDIASVTAGTSKSFTIEITLTSPGQTSTSVRVADINTGNNNSDPAYLAVFNGQLYFRATGSDNTGPELRRYDPATNAVTLVKDIVVGTGGADPSYLTVFNNALYFRATGDANGAEMWRFNGSDAGRLTDINPDAGNANPSYMTVFNNALYFSAKGNDTQGTELWRTDGTTATIAADINTGPGDSNPSYLTVFNNMLYFSAVSTDGFGVELWRYDGTNAPTRVSDINPNVGNSNPAYLTVFNNALYFSANANDGKGIELYRYDGTNAPSIVADISVGAGDSAPSFLAVFNNALYFSANGDNTGTELWKYTGTGAPTRVSDINTAGNSNPSYLVVFNNELYFQANSNDGTGTELWKFKGP